MFFDKYLSGLFFIISIIIVSPNYLLSMDYGSSADEMSITDFEDIEPLTPELVENISIEEWKDRPMISGDFLYLAEAFINMMISIYGYYSWVGDDDVSGPISNILSLKDHVNFAQLPREPLLPCVAKLVLPPCAKFNVIGDTHGNIDAAEDLLDSLLAKMVINKFMKTLDEEYVFFLGDYFDRGENNFMVFSTALLLAIKNRGKVFLLRGNHEFISKSKQDNLGKEFKLDEAKKAQVMNFLTMTYELLPAEFLLGYSGQRRVSYKFLVHASPDIRFDYTDLLEFNSEGYVNPVRDLCFWMLKPERCLGSSKVQNFFSGLNHRFKNCWEGFQALFCKFKIGFWENDIEFQSQIVLTDRSGSGHSTMVSYDCIKEFCDLFLSEQYCITGIVHGHQHFLPKKFPGILIKVPSSGCCCLFALPQGHAKIMILNKGGNVCLQRDLFDVFTVISASIPFKGDEMIEYFPTFLRMQYCDRVNANGWQMEVVY